MHQYGDKISGRSLGLLLWCLAVNGRGVKSIEGRMFEVMDKMKDNPLALLFYLTVNEI